jgi:hypothetical protein
MTMLLPPECTMLRRFQTQNFTDTDVGARIDATIFEKACIWLA